MSFTPEYSTAQDPSRDFCLWTYEPPRRPERGDLQGVNLLYKSAEIAQCFDEYLTLTAGLRRSLGAFETVWGVKWNGEALGTELYFYDYDRLARRFTLATIAEGLSPLLNVSITVDEKLPYFMTSLELPMKPGGMPARLHEADVYIGNPGSSVSSGICYRRDAAGYELKNFYFFFDRATEWDDILAKIACSAQLPATTPSLNEILPPFLRECEVIVVSNKRNADAIYASRVRASVLKRFLQWMSYPAALIEYLDENEDKFAHLLFDVGFDYTWADGALRIENSSFYNVF